MTLKYNLIINYKDHSNNKLNFIFHYIHLPYLILPCIIFKNFLEKRSCDWFGPMTLPKLNQSRFSLINVQFNYQFRRLIETKHENK